MSNVKNYRYQKNQNESLDKDYERASQFGKVKIGDKNIFWKNYIGWYFVPMESVQRAYRRVEAVNTKMCCGNVNFDIQKLVLITCSGDKLELRVGDGMPVEAEQMFELLKTKAQNIQYGLNN